MIVSILRFLFPISFVLFPTDFHVSNRHRFQYNFLHITGASVPKNYFKENITVFRYPEMTILLVLKHSYNEHFLYPSSTLGGYIL